MKVLYVTFLESVTHNGIYDTQVKQLLCRLAAQQSAKINVSHCAFLPGMVIGRKGVTTPFFGKGKEFAALKKEYEQCGVSASFIFIPVILLKRWDQRLPIVGLLLLLSLPLLLFRIVRTRPDVIHCRSYAATALALLAKLAFRDLQVVFDPRGFWPEEGVVMANWKQDSLAFRVWKRVEKHLLRRSDKVIALSELFAERIAGIAESADCALIYACADLEQFKNARQFRAQKRHALGLSQKTVFVYNGSLHAWHDPVLLARLMCAIRKGFENSKLLVVTKHSKEKLDELFRGAGLVPEDYLVIAAASSEVPAYLAAADYGLVPLREVSEQGAFRVVADTMIGLKVTEYLATGLPIVVNREVRGLHTLMSRFKIGTFFDAHDLEAVVPAIRQIEERLDDFKADCMLVADRYLSLDAATQSYFEIYQELFSRRRPQERAVSMPV